MKNFCRKKSRVPSAFYFPTLLLWVWSRLHSRERCTLLQGVTVLGFLLNNSVNHWEFSDQSGHSWNVLLPCVSSEKCSAYPLVIFYLGFFKVPPLYVWPSTQQCLHNVPVLISSAFTTGLLPLQVCPTTSSPLRLSNVPPPPQSKENAGLYLPAPTSSSWSKNCLQAKSWITILGLTAFYLLSLKDHSQRLLDIHHLKTVVSYTFPLF